MHNLYTFARQYQTFSSVNEMNINMNNYFYNNIEYLTEGYKRIFDILKQYACKVPGVSWLKRETLAEYAQVSVKTVERALNTFKNHNVLKIVHTKRKNGLKGPSFYVLLPYNNDEELILDAIEEGDNGELKDSTENRNVALNNIYSTLDITTETALFIQRKFFINSLNSFKFFLNSFKTNKDDDEKEHRLPVKKSTKEEKNIDQLPSYQQMIYEIAKTNNFSTDFSRGLAIAVKETDIEIIKCTTELKTIFKLAFKRLDDRIKNKKSKPITNIPAYFPHCIKTEIELYLKNKATAVKKNKKSNDGVGSDVRSIVKAVKCTYQGKKGIPKWLIVNDAVEQVKALLKLDEETAGKLVNDEMGIKAEIGCDLELEEARKKLDAMLAGQKNIVA